MTNSHNRGHWRAVAIVATMLAPCVATMADAPEAAKKPDWTITGSLRVREELWDWFGTGTGKGHYAFTGELLRLAANRTTKTVDTTVELQQTGLFDLPKTATMAAPQGQLGMGASYFDASGNQQFGIALKQAFWKLKDPANAGNYIKGGRFEVIDGTETTPSDPTLAALKRDRIAHRLIGNFGFSHVGRSFDGAQLTQNSPRMNLTLFGGLPVSGVFDQKASDTIERVGIGYGALTFPLGSKGAPSEARLFGVFYEDDRRGVTKSDNRPAAIRAADKAGIRINTVGAHYLRTIGTGCGGIDLLAWGAYQTGQWGLLNHEAYAYAAEAGIQPAGLPWKLWFRVGYDEYSGDRDPSDGRHGTFFPILPTPRIYARFPFFSELNLKDAFAEVILRPTTKLLARLDVHKLALANPNDLWYTGGGAFQDKPNFGYAARPSGGFGSLATLVDLSIDYQLRKSTALTLYLAHADGGNVVQNIYPGHSATFAYFEVTQKW